MRNYCLLLVKPASKLAARPSRMPRPVPLPVCGRKGELPPEEFVLRFRELCGSRPEAAAVLAELAALLPTAEQQRGLRAAAQATVERGGMPAAADLNVRPYLNLHMPKSG